MKLVFATNNAHKLEEVREILGSRYEVWSLKDAGFEGEIPESHETIEENSEEKAHFVFNKIGIPVFSDDSGLEIQALNGKPGVHSAHYAGTRDAKENMNKVLAELDEEANREAQFKSVMTFTDGKVSKQFSGIVKGTITQKIVGEDGFGYDPIFIPKGYDQTFAQLPSEVKNSISHRKGAVESLLEYLNTLV